jgi:hypothetical protein
MSFVALVNQTALLPHDSKTLMDVKVTKDGPKCYVTLSQTQKKWSARKIMVQKSLMHIAPFNKVPNLSFKRDWLKPAPWQQLGTDQDLL